MQVNITKPKIEHAEAIRRICSTGWRQTVEGLCSEEYQEQNIEYWYNIEKIQDDIENGTYTHVAIIDSKVVGTIGGAMTGPETGQIFVFYMDPTYRYKGIGKKLLNIFTEDQKQQGATEQVVSVQKDNQYGIPFYEARGFRPIAEKVSETSTGEQLASIRYYREI
ncbi:GNAT family N-acetyltransferase [Piscibacillus halophilus]|uniref:Ribosomal protein S18 acetylase RimI n=1 Tax=Piscibacillus halophilus TaxID=571933 RepID=A0A1H9DGW3_9BACI|nr:GNAT family N-acetyltransferase [Piscibacillus halophilus]SEQ12745.1 Ribosomal protein S18 acetylase RimI [Piscibacillus halophilus]